MTIPIDMMRKLLVAGAAVAALTPRLCTCHPDDRPPRPCPRKFAMADCRKAAMRASPCTDQDGEG